MWISRKRWENLERGLAVLEAYLQEQQEISVSIVAADGNTDDLVKKDYHERKSSNCAGRY